ncbi:rhomboid family intramembrane serine protease [Aureibacillus halotolerans]|uniref:Membrane associated rhomboid family serine protease n=1 Tax=Aureibacillus halotolerans TaxID=1508390 RepID=A0A4R6U113_9BACI|nr:rhomboid family intramembrane serine protease [Aureibacillus halotolerans]TDQ36734.1 membrane associated rhomboid family serine protease [Aureibacillus halotolerans]
MFIRTESFKGFTRLYPVITALVGLQLFLMLYIELGLPFSNTIYTFGLGFNPAIVLNNEYWRLLTPIFLHAGLMHVIFNCFSLVLFGPALEDILGKFRFLVLFLGSGVLANLASVFADPNLVHVGSSGAVYALFGAYVYMIFDRKDLIDRQNAQIVLIILVIGVVMSAFSENVNLYAHMFGFVAGAVLAPLLLINRPKNKRF